MIQETNIRSSFELHLQKVYLHLCTTLRILGMSWGVKNTFFEAPGVSLGGSGVSIGGVKILRVGVAFHFGGGLTHSCHLIRC